MAGYIETHFKRTISEIAADLAKLYRTPSHAETLTVRLGEGAPFWFVTLAKMFTTVWKPSAKFFDLALINAEVGQSFAVAFGQFRANPVTTPDRYAAELGWVMELAINRYARFEFMRAVRRSEGRSMTLVPISAAKFESEVKKKQFSLTLNAESLPEVVAEIRSPSLDRLAYCYVEWFTCPADWVEDASLAADLSRDDAERELAAEAKRRAMTVPELTAAMGVDYIASVRQTHFSASFLPRVTNDFQKTVRPLIVSKGARKRDLAEPAANWTPSNDGVTVEWRSPARPNGDQPDADMSRRPPRPLD